MPNEPVVLAASGVTVPYNEGMVLLQLAEVNNQSRTAITGKCCAWCKREFGVPSSISTYGFNLSVYPDWALEQLTNTVVSEACSPLIPGKSGQDGVIAGMIDVGLVGPNTLAGVILLELRRRLMEFVVVERKEKVVASQPTTHEEV